MHEVLKQNIVKHITKIHIIKSMEELQLLSNAVKNLLKINNDTQFKI